MGGGCSSAEPPVNDNNNMIETSPGVDTTAPMLTPADRRPSAIIIASHSDKQESAADQPLVTPRRKKALYSGVVNTPKGAEINVYKYFCPICTLYFQDILRSQCCGNYSCVECTTLYIDKRGHKTQSISDILCIDDPSLPCLSCGTEGFQPKLVHHEELIRDYSRHVTLDTSAHDSTPGALLYSPVKIGDSYENLKKKMQPFPDIRQQALFSDDEAVTENNDLRNSVEEKESDTSTPANAATLNNFDTASVAEVLSESIADTAGGSTSNRAAALANPVEEAAAAGFITVSLSASVKSAGNGDESSAVRSVSIEETSNSLVEESLPAVLVQQ